MVSIENKEYKKIIKKKGLERYCDVCYQVNNRYHLLDNNNNNKNNNENNNNNNNNNDNIEKRFYCLYCDIDQNSFDICSKCAKEREHPHPLQEINIKEVVEVKVCESIGESLVNRFMAFKERRLFGILKRKDEREENSPICLEYVNESENDNNNNEKMKQNIHFDQANYVFIFILLFYLFFLMINYY